MIVSSHLTLDRMMTLLDHLEDGVFVIEDGKLVYASGKLVEILGYETDDVLYKDFLHFVAEEDRAKVMANYQARLEGKNPPAEYEFHLLSKSGEKIIIRLNVGVYTAPDGSMSSIGSVRDLRETKQTMQELARSKKDIESILENMPDVFYRTDMQGVITLMSPSVEEVLGFSPEEMFGRHLAEFYCSPADREKILKSLAEGQGKARQVEACLKHKDGSTRWIMTNAYMKLNEDGQPVAVEGIARDISERKEIENRLLRLSRYDDLTQIYNRRVFYTEADKQLQVAQRYHRPAAALMMDLDHFKRVNDSYGHHTGDEVLKQFSLICQNAKRQTDVIGRTGGEEFAIFMPETELEDAIQLAERIVEHTRNQRLEVEGNSIHFTVSVGVAVLESQMQQIDELLSAADKALYQAKHQGRDQVCIFGE